MRRLTDAELAEPDVWLRVPIEKWNELPYRIQSELCFHLYRDEITTLVFRLAGYRWRDIQAMLAEVTHTICQQ